MTSPISIRVKRFFISFSQSVRHSQSVRLGQSVRVGQLVRLGQPVRLYQSVNAILSVKVKQSVKFIQLNFDISQSGNFRLSLFLSVSDLIVQSLTLKRSLILLMIDTGFHAWY